jgi:hypothetical protein
MEKVSNDIENLYLNHIWIKFYRGQFHIKPSKWNDLGNDKWRELVERGPICLIWSGDSVLRTDEF